jgi:hypothetical protein
MIQKELHFKIQFFKIIFTIFLLIGFDKGYAQGVFMDTIVYSGSFKIKNKDFSFRRIKEVGENLTKGIISNDDKHIAYNETLEIYNDKKIKVLSCQTSELMADCNSASIFKSKCVITDSSIEITTYCFWSGLCVGCNIGIIYETYKLNNEDSFEIVKKIDKTFIELKDKPKYKPKEILEFENFISKYGLLEKKEKIKLIAMIKK